MDLSMVTHIISKGECEDVEFKNEEVKAKDIAETICAFANKKGGYILFGIENGTKRILGVTDIGKLEEKVENANRDMLNPMADIENRVFGYEGQRIVVAHVKAGNTLHTAYKTRQIFVRIGMSDSPADIDAIIKILSDRGRMYFEDFPVNDATYEDLDIESVNRYLKQKEGKDIQREPKTILASTGLLKDNKPTVATILLFGAQPESFFPNCCILATKFQKQVRQDDDGNEVVEELPPKEITMDGNLCDLVLNGIDFVMNESIGFESLWDAIWEAIINAVVHRDYSIPGAIELKIWDDRIQISNPGGLAGGRTMNDLLANPMSIPRNPRIARIMSELGFGDNRCKGVYKIRTDSISDEKTEAAIFSENPLGFSVVLSLKVVSDDIPEEEIKQIEVNNDDAE